MHVIVAPTEDSSCHESHKSEPRIHINDSKDNRAFRLSWSLHILVKPSKTVSSKETGGIPSSVYAGKALIAGRANAVGKCGPVVLSRTTLRDQRPVRDFRRLHEQQSDRRLNRGSCRGGTGACKSSKCISVEPWVTARLFC
jgi:hypothetical protein